MKSIINNLKGKGFFGGIWFLFQKSLAYTCLWAEMLCRIVMFCFLLVGLAILFPLPLYFILIICCVPDYIAKGICFIIGLVLAILSLLFAEEVKEEEKQKKENK